MSSIRTRWAKGARALAASAVAAMLGGCLDFYGTIDLRQDGTMRVDAEGRFLPEARDAMTMMEAFMAATPDMARFANQPGCEALVASAIAENAKLSDLKLTGKQFLVGDRLACRVGIDAGRVDNAIDLIEKGLRMMEADNPAAKINYFSIKAEGPRRYRMTLDMDKLFEDGRNSMKGTIDQLLKLVPGTAPPPSEAAVAKVLQKYDRMIIGIYRMFERHYPGMRFEITLKAPRIVETNMQRDGNSARLVQTYADYLAMAERPELRKGKTYFVVFEY